MAVATSTAMTIAAVSTVAGAGISAYGAYEAGQNRKDMFNYQAEVARVNAINADNNADMTRQQNAIKLEENRRRQAFIKAQTEASFAKSGMAMSGSPLLVMMEQAEAMELENQNMFISGENQATAIEYQATQLESQASVYDAKAGNANRASYLNVGSSLLQGVSGAASAYGTGKAMEAKGL